MLFVDDLLRRGSRVSTKNMRPGVANFLIVVKSARPWGAYLSKGAVVHGLSSLCSGWKRRFRDTFASEKIGSKSCGRQA